MSKSPQFGKRSEPHTIIIAKGQEFRHFTVRPWAFALGASVFLAISIGYILATTYMVFRDDLINSSIVRQARLQHAYEDRISALRTQVDRITSHRLLDQKFMEGKIAELTTRQSLLSARAGRLMPVLERAGKVGLTPGDQSNELPVPQLRPGTASKSASLGAFPIRGIDPVETASIDTNAAGSAEDGVSTIVDVRDQLTAMEGSQVEQISLLAASALSQRNELIQAAKEAGLPISLKADNAIGGPYIPAFGVVSSDVFDQQLNALEEALDKLDQARSHIKAFPISNPVPGHTITSGFGNRKDPLIKSNAFHAGIDFRTPTGTPIHVTAPGKVIRAGSAGGYGNLVEVQHANGLTTRYAHLSRIRVKAGEQVSMGQQIGDAGSTGRSTGPHLHYEVRQGGKAVNPMGYLKAGKRLEAAL